MHDIFKRLLSTALLALAPCGAALAAGTEVPQQLRVCGDQGEFAPYTYYSRGADAARGAQRAVAGYNVDYLAELLAPAGRKARFTLLPWKRCLAMAAAGEFDLVLDAAGTAERRRDFLLARAHYRVTPIIMFHKRQHPGLVDTAAELSALSRCEVLGWDYSGAGMPSQPDSVSRPATLSGALAMLQAGRCQVMLYNEELLPGLRQAGEGALLDGIDYLPVAWVPSYEMHFAVSRKISYAAGLLALLNQGIGRLAKTGTPERLLRRHLAP